MIIEQEKTIQRSLALFVERLGDCEVFLAGSGKEGVSLFGSVHFDVVLCGDRLPDGNGLDVVKELMGKNPGIATILMTVHGDEHLKQEAMAAGVRAYLEKPFDLKQLEKAMQIPCPSLPPGGEKV